MKTNALLISGCLSITLAKHKNWHWRQTGL